jgi:PIN domain nuclease of toxin-antitoxin system
LRLLLDTHIWLWSLQSSRHLGHRVRQELKNSTNEWWLSPVSTWEALVLRSKRKIELPQDLREWVALAVAPFREAPLTQEIALAAEQVILAHRDPADRFLAATAQVLDLTLVTADARLLGLGEIATLANR